MLKKEEVLKIANLAKLELTQEDLELFGKQLSETLDLFKEIDDIDTESIVETSQVTGIENIAFEDRTFEDPEINPIGDEKNLTENIPAKDGSAILVPAVMEK